jgi:hypothetical protein
VHVALVGYSLGNRPDESEALWGACSHILGVISSASIALVLARCSTFSPALLLTGVGALASFVTASALQGQFFVVVKSVLHYIYMMPLFILEIPSAFGVGCAVQTALPSRPRTYSSPPCSLLVV